MQYLIIPGLYNSGPQHWQTIWEQSNSSLFTRVNQDDWNNPDRETWVQRLNYHINQLNAPTILVAHSLGCITVAHWASEFQSPFVKGALLVAPADVESSNRPNLRAFAPVPLKKLEMPGVVVASMDDHYCAIHRAARWAAYWQTKFVCVGNKGHINSDSRLGNWQEGFEILVSLGESIESKSYRFAS